jgi:hypothetical protein
VSEVSWNVFRDGDAANLDEIIKVGVLIIG